MTAVGNILSRRVRGRGRGRVVYVYVLCVQILIPGNPEDLGLGDIHPHHPLKTRRGMTVDTVDTN